LTRRALAARGTTDCRSRHTICRLPRSEFRSGHI
jgi:hypothetical protein